jgi:hypothetical protein
MVRKRAITRSDDDAKKSTYLGQDEEVGRPAKDRKYRFRDHENLDPDDQRRVTFKKKLIQSVDRSDLEKYRKSNEEASSFDLETRDGDAKNDQLKNIKDKKVRAFYEEQNERLDDWLEVNAIVKALSDDILESFDPRDDNGDGIAEGGGGLQDTEGCVEPFLPPEEQEKRRIARRNAKWAININILANILLLIAKAIAAGYSSSLSLIASLVDSALDLLCTFIVYMTHQLVLWHLSGLRRKFPVGRRRLEPLGILVFSVIMIISFAQILQESVEKLISKGPHEPATLPPVAIGAMAATIGLKGIIWFGCIRIKTTQVQALAQGTSLSLMRS